MTKLRSVTVKFLPEVFEQIEIIAKKRGETISDTIRYLLKRGLEERIYEENTDLLASVVRTQLEQTLKAYAVYPNLDNVEHPLNRGFTERLVLYRPNRDSNQSNLKS
ncbi:MAG TPA: hypothetical protein DER33_07230 [Syntrophomonas sp.]|jgi:predicted double-glycine peptidase|nr:hypothetical protein [Syntrophomonas sp.]HCF71356.1 hypothetical protein [Syntrophomonas sp.]